MTEIPPAAPPRSSYRAHYRRAHDRKPGLMLQTRDFDILEAVWANRFLTLSLLTPLFPADVEKTPPHIRSALAAATPNRTGTNLARRLGKLYHHGYLDRIKTVRGGALVYALAQRGARLLRDRQPTLPIPDTDWAEKNRAVSLLFVEHALMIARLRVALILGTQRSPAVTLPTFLPETQAPRHRWTTAGTDAYVNPDAFFLLRELDPDDQAHHAAFFVEADRSTMALKRLRQKYAFYSALRTERLHREPPFRIPGFRVLTVCRSNERALNLLKLVAGPDSPVPADHRAMFLFTTEETYAAHPENVLAAVWRSAADPQQPRSLIASPLPRL